MELSPIKIALHVDFKKTWKGNIRKYKNKAKKEKERKSGKYFAIDDFWRNINF